MAMLMIVIFAMAALSMDLAYLELIKTELRAATDASARAAASALIQGQTTAQVQAVAINTAAINKVAGKPLKITAADVTLGQSVLQSNGTYAFQAGSQPYQAVQVSVAMAASNANGAVPLFFGPFVGMNTYQPANTSVAAASACDVCLVLDRSHSMCWDETGTNWSYPEPYLGHASPYGLDTYGVLSTVPPYGSSGLPSGVFQQYPPQAGSRWMALQSAVQSFCGILQAANGNTHAAVVTWASPISITETVYSTIQSPYNLPTSQGVTMDVGLTSNMSAITAAVTAHSSNILIGGTDMYTGIEGGISVLTGSGSRPSATKVMILMTDGDWSSPPGNINPVNAASNAAADKITIHCIGFTSNANMTTCQEIASMTGGKFYYASNSASLTAIFQEIAGTLPVALTQ
jgi:Flp pilus assembly protein TadG